MNSKGVKLNLGCGIRLVKGFVNIDNSFDLKDLQQKKGIFKNAVIERGSTFMRCDMKKLPFKDNSVDYVESMESIEHIPIKEVVLVFNEIYRVLKPGHEALIVTLDFADIAKRWLEEFNQPEFSMENFFELSETIYGAQWTQGEYHRAAFSPWYIQRLANTIGFSKTDIMYYPRNSKPKDTPTMTWAKDGVLKSAFLYATLTK